MALVERDDGVVEGVLTLNEVEVAVGVAPNQLSEPAQFFFDAMVNRPNEVNNFEVAFVRYFITLCAESGLAFDNELLEMITEVGNLVHSQLDEDYDNYNFVSLFFNTFEMDVDEEERNQLIDDCAQALRVGPYQRARVRLGRGGGASGAQRAQQQVVVAQPQDVVPAQQAVPAQQQGGAQSALAEFTSTTLRAEKRKTPEEKFIDYLRCQIEQDNYDQIPKCQYIMATGKLCGNVRVQARVGRFFICAKHLAPFVE